jgi:hypothetical protein
MTNSISNPHLKINIFSFIRLSPRFIHNLLVGFNRPLLLAPVAPAIRWPGA